FALISFWLYPSSGTETWDHLVETVLGEYIVNSLILLVGVGLITGVLGVSTAWLVAAYEFPWRRHLDWALLLPLSLPTYIISFTYGGMLDEMGPVQQGARFVLGVPNGVPFWFPEIRSLPGVILVMSLVLYPYVYLICRAVIASQIQHLNEVAQIMGISGFTRFFKVALPLVRPALVAGIGLAVMEALSDFGSVSFYGVPTFTTGIYRAWFNLGDLSSAARLSTLLLLFMFVVIMVEKLSRRRGSVAVSNPPFSARKQTLSPFKSAIATCYCGSIIVLGFGVPVGQLLLWSLSRYEVLLSSEFHMMVFRSLTLAIGVALVVVLLALLIRFAQRLTQSSVVATCNRIASLGYAIPGSVLSVGVLIPLAHIDTWAIQFTEYWFGWSVGLLLTGSIFALAYSYSVRFLAVAYNTLDGAFSRVPEQLDQAALCLSKPPSLILKKIHVPILRNSLCAAVALVLIDILKELPATLILRPFNFDTLATKTYELASEEQLPEASIYALSIVAAGLIPIYLLVRSMQLKTQTSNT
ncbi:MAG: iron ABC transporter permease, partial [Verrucomicrobiota bacterium]